MELVIVWVIAAYMMCAPNSGTPSWQCNRNIDKYITEMYKTESECKNHIDSAFPKADDLAVYCRVALTQRD